MNCATCYAPLADDARFCPACGKPTVPTETGLARTAADSGQMHDFVGREIAGRYRILKKLGEGGMGAVYRGEQISLKRQIAVKLLKPELSANQMLLNRFKVEAEAVAKLNHPNTVNIYDFGQDRDGTLFIAMEYIEGRSLRSVIHHDAPLPPARALAIAQQIAASLTDAHAHNIVHRDLKPDNVMLQDRGRERDIARVLDFGIAKLRDDSRATAMAMTQAGDMLGTPQYMSPEQIKGDPIDGRCDIYALGCILYEMLTARLPFEASTVPAMLSKHLLEMPPPPSARRPDLGLSPDLDRLVGMAMMKQPAARPPTMELYGEQLAAVLAAYGGAPQRATPNPSASYDAAPSAPTPPPPRTGPPTPPVGAAPTYPGGQVAQTAVVAPKQKGKLGLLVGLGAVAAAGGAIAVVVAMQRPEAAKPPPKPTEKVDTWAGSAAPTPAPAPPAPAPPAPDPAPPTTKNDTWGAASDPTPPATVAQGQPHADTHNKAKGSPPAIPSTSANAGEPTPPTPAPGAPKVSGTAVAIGQGVKLIVPAGWATASSNGLLLAQQKPFRILAGPVHSRHGYTAWADLARETAEDSGMTLETAQPVTINGVQRFAASYRGHNAADGDFWMILVGFGGSSYKVVVGLETTLANRNSAATAAMSAELFNKRVVLP